MNFWHPCCLSSIQYSIRIESVDVTCIVYVSFLNEVLQSVTLIPSLNHFTRLSEWICWSRKIDLRSTLNQFGWGLFCFVCFLNGGGIQWKATGLGTKLQAENVFFRACTKLLSAMTPWTLDFIIGYDTDISSYNVRYVVFVFCTIEKDSRSFGDLSLNLKIVSLTSNVQLVTHWWLICYVCYCHSFAGLS